MLKKLLLIILLFAGATGSAAAQKDYHSQTLYWTRYQNQLFFSPTLYWINDFDNRRYTDHNLQAQFIYHSRLHRRIKLWDVAAGVTYSVGYTNTPEQGYRPPRREIRPVAEASHEFPLQKIFVQNRLRIDNRFLQTDPEVSVFEESAYVMRFRYRLQVRIPLMIKDDKTPLLTLRVGDEIMFNSNKNFYDQNRIYGWVEYSFSKNFAVETGYMYIDQHAYGRDEYYARNVLRLALNHRVDLKKRKE